jgi:hypothetical protein
MKKLLIVLGAVGLMIALAGVALAVPQGQGGQGKGEGKGRQGQPREGKGGEGKEGRGGGGARAGVVFGTLQYVSGSTWTIKPEIPPHMKERREGNGKEMPKLPEKVIVTVNSSTKFWLNGAASSAGAFDTGAQVVVKLDKPLRDGGSVAVAVADPETAREYIMEKIKERGGPGGEGGPGRGGPGAEGRPGHRPMFGTITAVSASSITIKPEVPQFIKDKMAEKMGQREGGAGKGKGEGRNRALPGSITVSLSGDTKYFENSAEKDSNPFAKGDKVAIMAEGEPGSATAKAVSDYASAQQRMKQMLDRNEQREGKKGAKQGRPGKAKQ